jgi:hypothetical protein
MRRIRGTKDYMLKTGRDLGRTKEVIGQLKSTKKQKGDREM